MTVISFPRPPRQPPTPPPRAASQVDRAANVATTIAGIYARAMRARLSGDGLAIACARVEAEELLREEFHDIKREAIAEIRLNDE
jgi:hypothetical protein